MGLLLIFNYVLFVSSFLTETTGNLQILLAKSNYLIIPSGESAKNVSQSWTVQCTLNLSPNYSISTSCLNKNTCTHM